MLQSSWSRGPSQKLSKPAPKRGFKFVLRRSLQSAVRPVSVESRPNVSTSPTPGPQNNAEKETASTAATRRCTTPGFRANAGTLVATIKLAARRKHDSEVIELDIQKSHNTIMRK